MVGGVNFPQINAMIDGSQLHFPHDSTVGHHFCQGKAPIFRHLSRPGMDMIKNMPNASYTPGLNDSAHRFLQATLEPLGTGDWFFSDRF